ncbi:testicular acid phosphatase-like isoform X2, partial [Leptotrombidium deliense]
LKSVIALFRHGDRTPSEREYKILIGHENYTDLINVGYAALTNEGKNRMYNVGRFMRNRYRHFLTNNPQEIYIKSARLDRCLVSAELVAAGMYPPFDQFMAVACPGDEEKIEMLVQHDKYSLKSCNVILNYFKGKNVTNLTCSKLYYISSAFHKIEHAGYQLPNMIDEEMFDYLKKYQLQSDFFVAATMRLLGIYNDLRVPYGATLIFELYSNANSSYVKTYYYNETNTNNTFELRPKI